MDFYEGTTSTLGRAVSAHIRAQLGAQRISGKTLAARIGLSQNYVATRLRDEKPFTLDDVDAIVTALDLHVSAAEFIKAAHDIYDEQTWLDAQDAALMSLEKLWRKARDEWTDWDRAFVEAHSGAWKGVSENMEREVTELDELRARKTGGNHGASEGSVASKASKSLSGGKAAKGDHHSVSDRSGNLRAAQQRNVQAEHEALDD